jgi:hypothetical protein
VSVAEIPGQLVEVVLLPFHPGFVGRPNPPKVLDPAPDHARQPRQRSARSGTAVTRPPKSPRRRRVALGCPPTNGSECQGTLECPPTNGSDAPRALDSYAASQVRLSRALECPARTDPLRPPTVGWGAG